MADKTIFEIFSDSLDNAATLLDDDSVALDAPDYLSGLDRSLVEVQPTPPSPNSSASTDDERVRIGRELDSYAALTDPQHILLFTAPAGLGKTYAGVSFIHNLLTKITGKVLYLGTRHAFFIDVMQAAADQGNSPREWKEWLPRQAAGLNKDETCKHAEPIGEWQKKGYQSMDFCLGVCGANYVNKECPYHAQKNTTKRIIFGQHAHLVLGHPLAKEFEFAVGDENPMLAFYREWKIPRSHIWWDQLDQSQDLVHLLKTLQLYAGFKNSIIYGEELLRLMGGADRVLAACNSYPIINIVNSLVKPNTIDEAEESPYQFIPDLIALLRREAQRSIDGKGILPRVYLSGKGLTLILRNNVSDEMPAHVVWFDATGRQDIYEILFDRPVKVITCNPPIEGEIIQLTDRANNKTSLVREDTRTKTRRVTDKANQLVKMVDTLKDRHGGCDVVTYKKLVDEGVFPNALWFYANRGTNSLADCSSLAVVGTPQTPLYEIISLAKSLLFERDEPFDTRWISELRAYAHVDKDGKSWAKPISTFADEQLRIFLWQLREAEIIQSANRARMLIRKVPVYLLCNIPIDELPPNSLISIKELMGSPDGINVFQWSDVLKTADMIYAEKGYVESSDLEDRLGVTKKTAIKYMDELQKDGGWKKVLIKAGSGRPKQTVEKIQMQGENIL